MELELKAYEASPFAIQLVGEGFDPKAYAFNSTPTMEFIMAGNELDDKGIDWDEMLAVAKASPNAAIEQISKKLGIERNEILIHPVECQINIDMSEVFSDKDGIWVNYILQTCYGENEIARITGGGEEEGDPYDEKYAVSWMSDEDSEFYMESDTYKVVIELCDQRRNLSYDLVKAMLESSSERHVTFSNL